MKEKIVRYRPPSIAMMLLVVAIIIHIFLPTLRFSYFSCWPFGIILAILGFGIMGWGWAEFQSSKTAICPTERASTLVTSGPFRFSRNPMYLGMILMLISPFAWLGSLPFAFTALLFFMIIHFVFIPFEEERMHEIFGEQYAKYKRKVRKWI